MTYASIMVSLDLGAAAQARAQLAADLAGRFEARLIGVAARQVPDPVTATDIAEAERIYEAEKDRVLDEIGLARDVFERAAGGYAEASWRAALAPALPYLALQARAADLLVVGRHGAEDGDHGPLGVAPGPLLMEAGRPVLVVPPGPTRLRADRAVVAWKDAPEARRAVSAALPLLARASEVLVLGVEPEVEAKGLADVADFLVRHGVKASSRLIPESGIRPGEALLANAAAFRADLLVMGAYGHSRLREWLFGGATRTILQTTTTCCLMSH
ncbi:UspA domain protein [Methylobacterium sp. 4-46]|uniref:universal stress protein n=1 Tax=unclassified Methylobacterium TaxID=2615210 RepID=UPI000152D0F0|nr:MULTISPECIES: universal stress protein [Methylobacterium]ACA17674.1 UspA domain protein [Methylobacterium sp. 4-46]WFT83343.1 universal stress protein [Methylobacterium nodulans]